MSLRVYNTLTRDKEEFVPVTPGKVGIYLCGPTVYKPAHIGHMVGPVIFDTIKRYLVYCGYEVKFVINITDVDDKLINRANENGVSMKSLADEMTQDYFDNLETMGVDSIDLFPYATEHIDEMLEIIGDLVKKGHAYPLDGDVYFEVQNDEDYGKLSGRNIDDIMSGTRIETVDKKRHPGDFALWKSSKEGEPAWESPWGPGRPGWHIECSAMSRKHLGDTFDIHGGGLDLMFPHHENELAQSECCTGKSYAKYWMHNGLMQAGSQAGKVGGGHDRHGDLAEEKEAQEANKLAGSKGAASVKELFKVHDPETVRFFLLSTHYRSPIDFSDERIEDTGKGLDRFYRLIEAYERISGSSFYEIETQSENRRSSSLVAKNDFMRDMVQLRQKFLEAMDDDFNTGGAVGFLHEMVRLINGFVAEQKLESEKTDEALEQFTQAMTIFKELSNILGVFRKPVAKAEDGLDDGLANDLMQLIISLRANARANKQWEIADQIRDGLNALKVELEDRPDGTTWKRG